MIIFKRSEVCNPGKWLHDALATEQRSQDGDTRYTDAQWADAAPRIFEQNPAWLQWAETRMGAPVVRFPIDWTVFLRTSRRGYSQWVDMPRLRYFAESRGFAVENDYDVEDGDEAGIRYRVVLDPDGITIRATTITTRPSFRAPQREADT